jgi:hypothetical protein
MKSYMASIDNEAMRKNDTKILTAYLYRNVMEAEDAALRMSKKFSGLLDTKTYAMRQMADALLQNGIWKPQGIQTHFGEYSADAIFNQLALHIDESFIAFKNAADTKAMSENLETLDNAIKSLFGYKRQQDAQPMIDLINNLDITKEMKNVHPGYGKNLDFSREDMITAVKQLSDSMNGQSINDSLVDELSRSIYNMSKTDRLQYALSEMSLRDVEEVVDSVTVARGNKNLIHEASEILVGSGGTGANEFAGMSDEAARTVFASAPKASMAEEVTETMSALANSLKNNITANKLKLGLGFAAAIMGAAYIGGNPTVPAEGQAQGIQAQNASYEIPNLMSQYTAPNNYQHTNQSYLVNINADTDRGQEYVQQAMYAAFQKQSGMQGNINMTMNIKDTSSNISPRDMVSYLMNQF